MLLEPANLEIIAIVLIVLVWIELLIITLSYYIAYKIKRTFGVWSFLIYFSASTLIYFLFFFRMLSQYLRGEGFFESCAVFFIIINIFRFITAGILLVSIWKQNDK
jgi:hypothetical protein